MSRTPRDDVGRIISIQGEKIDGVIQLFDTPAGEYEVRLVSGGGVGAEIYARPVPMPPRADCSAFTRNGAY